MAASWVTWFSRTLQLVFDASIQLFAKDSLHTWLTHFKGGNQQFTSHSLAFINVGTAVDLLWDWGWTWKNIYVFNSDVGFNIAGDFMGGSMMLLDSHFEVVNLGISISTPKGSRDEQEFSMRLENIAMSDVKIMAMSKTSDVYLVGGSSTLSSWMFGKIYDEENADGSFKDLHSNMAHRDPSLVMTNGVASNGYFIRRKPQYEDKPADYFMNVHPTAKGTFKKLHAACFGMRWLLIRNNR